MKLRTLTATATVVGLSMVLALGALPAQALSTGYVPLPVAPSEVYEQAIPPSQDVQDADFGAWEGELANTGEVPVTAAGEAVETGAGASPLLGVQLGLMAGSTAIKTYYAATGQTGQELQLCEDADNSGNDATGKVIAAVEGIDCSSVLDNALTQAAQNNDTAPGTSYSGSACSTVTCVTVTLYKAGPIAAVVGGSSTSYGGLECATTSTTLGSYANTGVEVASASGVSEYLGGFLVSGGNTKFDSDGRYVVGTPCGSSGALALVTGAPASLFVPASFSATGTATTTPVRVTTTSGNPDRELVTGVTGSDGKTYTCDSATFTETDTALPAICQPALPAGVTPTGETITEHTPDGSAPDKTLSTQTATAAYQNLVANYPDCGTGACQMTVWINDQECTVGKAACIDWQSDTADDVEVEYGPATNPKEYQLTKTQGNILADYYDPQAQAEGTAYADPATGDAPTVQDSPDEDKAQQNATAPSTDPDGENSACWPSGWGVFNPLNWVEQPVQCALKWAFVPKSSDVQAAQSKMKNAYQSSAIGAVTALVAGWGASFAAAGVGDNGSNCGIPYDLTFAGGKVEVKGNFLDSCTGALVQPAQIVHAVLSGVLPTAGTLACLRYGAMIFGYGGLGSIINRDRGADSVRSVRFRDGGSDT